MANDDYGRGGWDRDDRFERGDRGRSDWRGGGRRAEGGEYARWGRGYGASGSPGNYDAGNYGDEEGGRDYDQDWRRNRLRDHDRGEDAGCGRDAQGGSGRARGGYGPGGTWSSDRDGWRGQEGDFDDGDYGFEGGAGRAGYGGMAPGQGYDRFTGGGIGGPNTEWGRGYGGGYGRSGEYGERGGGGRWGRGQQSGIGPDFGSSNYGGYGYSSGFSDMSQGRTSSYDTTFGARSPRSFAGRGPRNYRRSDERIQEEINEELTRHPEIDATDVEVRVDSGTVTLSGTVDSRHAKRVAEDICDAVSGVQEVENQLRVRRSTGDQHGSKTDREVNRAAARETGVRRSGTSGTSGATSRGRNAGDRNAS